MRAAAAAIALALALPVTAQAASRFHVRGAGWGHGIGMSQYGAYGFAKNGQDYRFILGHYYTATDIGKTDPDRIVRVLLTSSPNPSFTGASRAGSKRLRTDRRYRVVRYGSGKVELRSDSGKRIGRFTAPLVVRGKRLVLGNGGRYRGRFEFRPGTFSGVNAINAVTLESYVRGVIARESPSSWPAEALKAQAVAARTYAITTDAGGAGFDQYPDVRSQVYGGIAAETPTTDAAVKATAGEVVTQNGEPVTTFFFSTSGGHTENIEFSFIGSPSRPWLKGVDDPFDDASPKHRWKLEMSLTAAQRKLGSLVKGKLKGIKVLDRGVSPRIVEAEVIGTKGRTRTSGPELRRRLGLNDTWASFTVITGDEEPAEAQEPAGQQPTNGEGGGIAPPPGLAAHARVHYLKGTIVPGKAGKEIVIQRRLHGPWQEIGRSRLLSRGRYRVRVLAPGRYRVLYRGLPGPSVNLR